MDEEPKGVGDLLGSGELVAQTPIEQKRVELPGNLGYPWSICQLEYVEYASEQDKEFRPKDGTRIWSVEYILSKSVGLSDQAVSLEKDAMGTSHLGLVRDTEITTRDDGSGESVTFKLLRNPDGTLGKIVVPVTADSPFEARMIAGRATSGLLGMVSFRENVPLHIGTEIVRDPESGWARFWMVLPAPSAALGPVKLRLPPDLRPIYALWRESRNSRSYFYRFLCLFKIVEGLLETILPRMYRDLAEKGKKFERVKNEVPDSKEMRETAPELVGKRFTRVRDELKGRYRHALAHFELDARKPLDLDDPKNRHEYERLFPVVDYMARALINEVERIGLSSD